MNKKILITGGSGFIGMNLINRLKKENIEIINLSNSGKIKGIKNINIDLTHTDFSFLNNIDFDCCIHLAAISSPKRCRDKKEAFKLNVKATKRLFDKLFEMKIKKLIFSSSSLVYNESNEAIDEEFKLKQDSEEIYTKTKIMGEDLCLGLNKKGVSTIIFRLSNGYGPSQQFGKDATLIPQLISQSILEKKIILFNNRSIRDYIYVGDIVDAIILGTKSPYSGVLNLGTGVGVSSGKIAKIISEKVGAEVKNLDKEIIGPEKIVLNINKIKKILNWTPKVNINEGLTQTIKYYEKLLRK